MFILPERSKHPIFNKHHMISRKLRMKVKPYMYLHVGSFSLEGTGFVDIFIHIHKRIVFRHLALFSPVNNSAF